MKAAQISEYGDSSKIKIVEIEIPKADSDEVLIEVYGSSLNPFDTTVRAGRVKDSTDKFLPFTLGGDVAGVVKELGAKVDNFKKGDRVFGSALILGGGSGAFAEFAVAKANRLGLMPTNADFKTAGVMPLVGLSAIQAIYEHMNLKAGQKLFVHGASGGIGSVAVQIAKHLGAYVAGSSKSDGISFIKGLGVDAIVDTSAPDYFKTLKDYDALFNTVAEQNWDELLSVLKPGGIAVSMVGAPEEAVSRAHNVTVIAQGTTTDIAKLNMLKDLMEHSVVKVQIGASFSLEQVAEAFRKREAGGINGKVAIEVRKS